MAPGSGRTNHFFWQVFMPWSVQTRLLTVSPSRWETASILRNLFIIFLWLFFKLYSPYSFYIWSIGPGLGRCYILHNKTTTTWTRFEKHMLTKYISANTAYVLFTFYLSLLVNLQLYVYTTWMRKDMKFLIYCDSTVHFKHWHF